MIIVLVYENFMILIMKLMRKKEFSEAFPSKKYLFFSNVSLN